MIRTKTDKRSADASLRALRAKVKGVRADAWRARDTRAALLAVLKQQNVRIDPRKLNEARADRVSFIVQAYDAISDEYVLRVVDRANLRAGDYLRFDAVL